MQPFILQHNRCVYLTLAPFVSFAAQGPLATVQGAETHYICMTRTWHEYKEGGVYILANSMLQVRNQVNLLLILPLWLWDPAYQAGVASIWLLATVAFIHVWSRPALSMKWVGCLNHNLHHIQVRNRDRESLLLPSFYLSKSNIRLELHPHDH